MCRQDWTATDPPARGNRTDHQEGSPVIEAPEPYARTARQLAAAVDSGAYLRWSIGAADEASMTTPDEAFRAYVLPGLGEYAIVVHAVRQPAHYEVSARATDADAALTRATAYVTVLAVTAAADAVAQRCA